MSGYNPVTKLYEELRSTYGVEHHKDAHALFFKTEGGTPSFRFEVTELGWEFSNGWYIGPDPDGDFYYKPSFFNGSDGGLSTDGETSAEYYIEQLWEKHEPYIHIKFYAPNSTTDLLGEFVGKDLFIKAEKTGLLRKRSRGNWAQVDYEEAILTISKEKDSTLITVKNAKETLKAEVHCTTGDTIYGEAINNVRGKLYIKDRSKLGEALRVRWYSEVAVFHKGWNATELSAFFYPIESPNRKPLGSKDDYDWDNVKWTIK